jgi:hypothetical protein
MDKPQEIIRFACLALAASVINAAATIGFVKAGQTGTIGAVAGVLIVLALVLWVARGRSMIARVVLTIWLAFGIGVSLAAYGLMLIGHRDARVDAIVHVLSLVTVLFNCAALYFLWSQPATAWLQKRADIS